MRSDRRLIVFDMDGVLVDVSSSYRDVVRETTYLFFKGAKGFNKLPRPLFPLDDLAVVKGSGGLNNDWELTYLVISLLLEYAEIDDSLYRRITDSIDRANPQRSPDCRVISEELLKEFIPLVDVSPLGEYLEGQDMPLSRMYMREDRRKKKRIHPLVDFFSRGDVDSGNVVKRIFQEVYLGRELFKKIYGFAPLFYSGIGFIDRERLIIGREVLEKLSKGNVLAVATGRPRVEAEYALNRFEIGKYFSEVLTLDECMEEEKRILRESGTPVSLSKPHPYMLDRIAEEFRDVCSSYYLVGDMPDDMISAMRSSFGYTGIGFVVNVGENRGNGERLEGIAENLKRCGAKKVFFSVEELKNFFDDF